ncbi:MAG TPA: response regulator [Bacteroidetes bacterium]|nr:response regulator [Bacteroidota bacterium]
MLPAAPILVVDDSPTLRAAVEFVLKREGFEVAQAGNGVQALEVLRKWEESGQRPALIISDIHMPQMNGLEFIRRAKATPTCRFVPVLVLTTERGEHTKLEAKRAGAAGWINKPFNAEALVKAVHKLIRRPQTHAGHAHGH